MSQGTTLSFFVAVFSDIMTVDDIKKCHISMMVFDIKQIQQMHYSFHSTPTCTFKSRSQTVTKSNQRGSVPGPADYQIKKPLPQSGTVAQTTQKRNLFKKFQANPGPGSYESKSYITDGIKRSMSLRFINYNKNSPGPQDYQVEGSKILNKSPAFSIGNRSKSTHQIDFEHNSYKPGPTNYEKKGTFNTKNGTIVGSSQRKELTETQKTPGPNYYKTESAVDFTSSVNPRCKMGSQLRKTAFGQGELTPGPAQYNKSSFVQENTSKKKGYSCRQKVNDLIAQQLSRMPAPGMYESHLKNKSQAPRCATTQTKRKTFMDDMQTSKKDQPGPGYHEPGLRSTKYRSASANMFSKSSRRPLDENEKTPGPVGYNSDRINLLNTAPKYSSVKSVAKSEFLQINPENPAPGQYDPKITLVKPGSASSEVPRQRRPGFEHHRKTPGPGYYNLNRKQQGPTWKFPTQKRISFTDSKNEAKNGTHYQVGSKVIDPPSYMNVTSKVNFDGTRTGFSRT